MQLIMAAVASVVAALAEFTIVPYLKIDGTAPHPVLVFGVIWAIAGSLEAGLTWAFVGGLALDALGQRPLGSSGFALLISVGAASVISGILGRARIVAPVVAIAITSTLYSMLLILTTSALTNTPSAGSSGLVSLSVVYDTVLGLVFGPLAVTIVARRRNADRVNW
jgi:rod shape-determining protein MreD